MENHDSDSDALGSFSDDSGDIELTDEESTGPTDTRDDQLYQLEPQRNVSKADQQDDEPMPDVEAAHADQDRLINTDWCQCKNCVLMPTVTESICCKEITKVSQKMEDTEEGLPCILERPGFDPVCLNPYVLETA
ncbi:uncharacterized protein LOC117315204 [Pecten maximus]|uniref:uncharacterized protein LOC117315204 n=1 Tax=Pecten maximus TaxID=6579 RepID=UPI00145807C7|nr:uncharacterized protein LOC117315204 [Pecten maximus]